MTQAQRLLKALDDGDWHRSDHLSGITKITRIAARIYDVRKQGHAIETRRGKYGFEEYRLIRGHTLTFLELQELMAEQPPKSTLHQTQLI